MYIFQRRARWGVVDWHTTGSSVCAFYNNTSSRCLQNNSDAGGGGDTRWMNSFIIWRSYWKQLCPGHLSDYCASCHQFQVWSLGLTISVFTSQYKLKTCLGCWVSGIPWNTNKASVRVRRMGGDGSFRGTPQCSFTLTLYSLDVVTVNLSISFPRFKKGDLWRGWVVQPCPQCTLCSPSPLQPSAGPSSHQHKLLTVWSSLLFFSDTPFIFQRKKIFIWIRSVCPSFSPFPPQSSSFLFPQT